MGLRETILAADDSRTETVSVPEWGTDVLIRSWTGSERDRLERRFTQAKDGTPMGARSLVAILSICDEKGERIFKDTDEAEVSKKSAAALDRVFQAAIALNGFGEDEIEEQVKNS